MSFELLVPAGTEATTKLSSGQPTALRLLTSAPQVSHKTPGPKLGKAHSRATVLLEQSDWIPAARQRPGTVSGWKVKALILEILVGLLLGDRAREKRVPGLRPHSKPSWHRGNSSLCLPGSPLTLFLPHHAGSPRTTEGHSPSEPWKH